MDEKETIQKIELITPTIAIITYTHELEEQLAKVKMTGFAKTVFMLERAHNTLERISRQTSDEFQRQVDAASMDVHWSLENLCGTGRLQDKVEVNILGCKLKCATGEIDACVADTFGEWEIAGFTPDYHDPHLFCKQPNVRCRHIGETLPTGLERFMIGPYIDLCGDSVAGALLTKQDGKPRDARGSFLAERTEAP